MKPQQPPVYGAPNVVLLTGTLYMDPASIAAVAGRAEVGQPKRLPPRDLQRQCQPCMSLQRQCQPVLWSQSLSCEAHAFGQRRLLHRTGTKRVYPHHPRHHAEPAVSPGQLGPLSLQLLQGPPRRSPLPKIPRLRLPDELDLAVLEVGERLHVLVPAPVGHGEW